MDEFVAKLTEYMNLAEEAIVGVAPEVWDLTLGIIRVQGVIWCAGAILLLLLIPVYWRFVFKRILSSVTENAFDGLPKALTWGLSMIGTGFAFGLACDVWLLNINAWLSIIEPKAALVYRVGQSVGIF